MYAAFWFRRDLRLDDNNGLYEALRSGLPVLPVFIFDRAILDQLARRDARVEFIHKALGDMQAQLVEMGSSLVVRAGKPEAVWAELLREYPISAVYTNHDYEPYARQRDEGIAALLRAQGTAFHTFKDQVIFEKDEVLSGGGTAYTVFTPYSRKWRQQLTTEHVAERQTEPLFPAFRKTSAQEIPSLAALGFEASGLSFPPRLPDKEIIRHYDQKRNFPAEAGTTHVGLHLRFGTLSLRKLVRVAQALNDTYLNELIWREFYMQFLWHFPYVAEGPFKKEYSRVPWRDDAESFERWKNGETGYPLVDAGMRELNATGYMHNRVRMVVASFLSKHLLIHWQWGEAYFAEKLLDFELSSNNGGWQWAAGCGADAAPYFRIFNPEEQLKKFDARLQYTRKWVPEYGTPRYARPIVEHKSARERCLAAYKSALNREL